MERIPKKHHIRLSPEERADLNRLVCKGHTSAQRQRHARILLCADEQQEGGGLSDAQIAKAVQTNVRTVERVRRSCVDHGLARALERQDPDRVYTRKLDGPAEAQLLALSCGPAPEGQARWTLRLLAQRLVGLEVVEAISHEAVRQTLKK